MFKEKKMADGKVDWSAKLEQTDIQALIVRGYKELTAARYVLLKIKDVAASQIFFDQLYSNVNRADKNANHRKSFTSPEHTAVNISFTSAGLEKLNVDTETFSREFKEGMNWKGTRNGAEVDERMTLLGDTGRNDPANWHWGNSENPVDCLIMLYAKNNLVLKGLNIWLKGLTAYNAAFGWEKALDTTTHKFGQPLNKEHFGFMDGISQPIIKGLSKARHNITTINPGEFILGYENEYNNFSPSPGVDDEPNIQLPNHRVYSGKKDLGKNGCYLVFRQLEQHVEEFWKFQLNSKEHGYSEVEKAVKLASKMVGRWPEGQPIATCPYAPLDIPKDAMNNFGYKHDPDGVNCPLGAHIRRTNPRDALPIRNDARVSLEVTDKHRMLRRGRIYGEPLEDFNIEKMIEVSRNYKNKVDPKGKINNLQRGLHFICLVSDISRQFEFVQNVWANTSTFANLCNEVDPLISPRPTKDQSDCHEFTTPQEVIRNRYKQVPEFTSVVGGEYFFLPGLTALKYIITRPIPSVASVGSSVANR